jgi:plasmid maintenance system antidote protein VapI
MLAKENTMAKRKTTKAPATLAEELKSALQGSELTSYAIGKAAGVSPITIGRFLRGERDVTLETAGKLAAVLGLHLAPIEGSYKRPDSRKSNNLEK